MHILRWAILALLAYGLFEAWRHRTAVLHSRVFPAFILWLLFQVYWSASSRNSAPTKSSESRGSTVFHQVVINVAYLLLFWPAPGLKGWFLPPGFPHLVAIGTMIEAAFILLAVWARRHLGRNWSAAVRIGEGHELVRTGPYRLLRHPIYTAVLGMCVGTAIASSQYHALLAVAMVLVAYIRKSWLEEHILGKTFGAEYDAYRRHTWALVPLVY
jgi:protein-S-isoprenylcysteine O-methyltransferase Ste14